MDVASSRWVAAKKELEGLLSPHVFSTWIAHMRVLAEDDQEVTLGVPDSFALNWINDHYRDVIEDVLRKQKVANLELRIAPALPRQPTVVEDPSEPETVEPTPSTNVPDVIDATNSKYIFDRFIVGPSNQLAFSAARSVADLSGPSFSPVVLVGGSGLGKTHLLHAVANELTKKEGRRRARVVLKTSEQFVNDVVRGIQTHRMEDVRKAYRHVDVLLIDDIQLISGKKACQEEFFHTFNVLHESQKRILVTSDRPPHEIPELEERIRTRFAWGLIARLESPDLDTRRAILSRKAAFESIPLDEDVRELLAQKIKRNVRELEGALVRLYATASLLHKRMDGDLARQVLELADKSRPVTVGEIVDAVSAHFRIDPAALLSEQRKKSIALPRQISMYLCRKHTSSSYPEIGKAHGGKHHTTAMNAEAQVTKKLTSEPEVGRHVEEIERDLELAD